MRHLLPIVLLLSLAPAAPAAAKEVVAAEVCGADGCASSRDRHLIAGLAEGGDPVAAPQAAAHYFRVRIDVADENGRVVDRSWMHFMPKGELIRTADGTWMRATEAYTSALKKVVDPSLQSYAPAGLAKLLGDSTPRPASGDGISATTLALVAGGILAGVLLLGRRYFSSRDSRRSASALPPV